MDDLLLTSTSTLLLERLQSAPRDEAAWGELVRGYTPAVRRWCRAWGLQAADAEDVTQTVLLKLARTMVSFRYDPSGSFRGYLKALARYAVCDALEALRREGLAAREAGVVDWLAVEDTRADLARCVEGELRRDLLHEAVNRVSRRVDRRTLEAFLLLSQERLPGGEVAARLGMTVAAVYMAKSRVVRMLREEVRVLSRRLADPSGL